MSARQARLVGQIVQGLVLGLALFLAVTQLIAMAGGTGVFRYEGF